MKLRRPTKAEVIAVVGGAAGALAIILLFAWRPIARGVTGIGAGDWLQSISTVVGVALTIWATLWLEERKRTNQRLEDQRLLREALDLFRSQLALVQRPLDTNDTLAKRLLLTAGHYELIRNSKASLAYARDGFRIRSFNLWAAFNALDQDFAINADKLAREEAIVRDPRNNSENVLAISREFIVGFAAEAMAPVNAAIEALKEEGVTK